MDMRPVSSSQVHSVGYDPDSQTLHVKFKDRTNKAGDVIPGSTYAYSGVPPEVHAGLLAADADEKQSVGSHFGKNIRGGGYSYRKVS